MKSSERAAWVAVLIGVVVAVMVMSDKGLGDAIPFLAIGAGVGLAIALWERQRGGDDKRH